MSRFRWRTLLKGNSAAAALASAAAIMLIPANLLPVLTTASQGNERSDTIFSGIVELWREGLGAIALIVFSASILIPVLKLVGLGQLLLEARARGSGDSRRLTRLYAAIDFNGRWSMLDVFLAVFLAGLVQFGDFSSVRPREGLVAFASAVILTMLATRAFDPRLLWPEPSK
jgi:paraquat-inducible protein A